MCFQIMQDCALQNKRVQVHIPLCGFIKLWCMENFYKCMWVRSWNCGCLVTWFSYQLIAKPGNKTATVPWPDPCTLSIKYTTWHLHLFRPSHTATFGCCWPFYRSPIWLRLQPLDCLYGITVSKVYGTLVITVATKQVLAYLVMNVPTTNLKIKCTHKFHLRVPHLQVSCSHLAGMRGYQESGFSNACQATCPIVGQFLHQKGWHIREE